MHYPTINADNSYKLWTQTFTGIDRRARAADGACLAMGNMTGERYPILSSRGRRGVVAELSNPLGLKAMEKLAWIDGSTLYYDGEATPIDNLSLDSGMLPKQMVSMGAYLLIFPDGAYYNTANPLDYGNLNRLYQSPANGTVQYTLCNQDGTAYTGWTVSDTAPEEPEAGDLWMDAADGYALKVYGDGEWVAITTVYVKIAAAGIGEGLENGDSVTVSGVSYTGEDTAAQEQFDLLNNTHIIQAVDDDYLVIIGIIDQNYTQSGRIRADRKAPEMDFVIECNNRLWGCRHGLQDGETVNRIYASALGDFKNWQRYDGTSQDSYFVDVGSDGPFTAAVSSKNRPYFFKEKVCHMIYGDRPSNWTMQTSDADGPQEGSGATLAQWNGNMIYLSRHGVQIYDGMAQPCGDALGEEIKMNGAAGVSDNTYYLSVEEFDGSSLYTYDCKRNIWHRQDDSAAVAFAELRGEMYMLCKNGLLYALRGKAGTLEDWPTWYMETAEMGYEYRERQYLRRFLIKMELDRDAACKMLIQYDGDGIWHDKGTMQGRGGVKMYLVPIVPRRCEHARIRLEGQGLMRLYGIGREMSMGSDGR